MKRVLLDENLDWRLKRYFSEKFEVVTIPDLGWQSKKNGELLAAMVDERFDFLVTSDKNLRFQQNLNSFKLQVVVVLAFDNRLSAISNRIAEIEQAMLTVEPGEQYIEVDLRS